MHRFLYNFLLCITVVAAVVCVAALMKPHMPDIAVIEPSEMQSVPESESKNTAEQEKKDLQTDTAKDDDEGKKIVIPPEKKSAPVELTGEKKIKVPESVQPEIKPEKITDTTEKKSQVSSPAVPDAPEKTEKKSSNIVAESKISVPEKSKKQIPAEEKKTAKTQNVKQNIVFSPYWLEDFEPDGHLNGVKFVDNWKREGGVLFTPKTDFYLRHDERANGKSVLVIESKKSSAVFACNLSGKIDLNKTPVLRWRWRVKKLPPNADGRHRKKDDQAVGIYIGSGTAFNQKSIAYRWETETPIGHWGQIVYSNVMKVRFYCQRNKKSGTNVWYEECRNVRDDFLAQFGFVPKNIALAICGNSQNSKSEALAEIDYIGFYEK